MHAEAPSIQEACDRPEGLYDRGRERSRRLEIDADDDAWRTCGVNLMGCSGSSASRTVGQDADSVSVDAFKIFDHCHGGGIPSRERQASRCRWRR